MRIPGRLSGSSSLVPWLNSLRDAIISLELRPGRNYRVRNSSEGQVLDFDTGGGVTTEIKTSPFKGLWNSDTSYQSGDIVIVQSGVACGVYISTVTPNYNQSPNEISGTNWPDTGNGWMQLSVGPISGQWY